MAKIQFEAMEAMQSDRFKEFARLLKKRAKQDTNKVNTDLVLVKERIVKSAVAMDKALASDKKKKSVRVYLDKAMQKLNYMETEHAAKAVRKTLHKVNSYGYVTRGVR